MRESAKGLGDVLLSRLDMERQLCQLAVTRMPIQSARQIEIADTCQLLTGQLSPFLIVQKLSLKFLPAELY